MAEAVKLHEVTFNITATQGAAPDATTQMIELLIAMTLMMSMVNMVTEISR